MTSSPSAKTYLISLREFGNFSRRKSTNFMESLRTVGGVGIVLGITWAEILRGFGEVLLIDARLIELEHRPLVGFLPRAIAKGGGGEQYQSGGRDCESGRTHEILRRLGCQASASNPRAKSPAFAPPPAVPRGEFTCARAGNTMAENRGRASAARAASRHFHAGSVE
jgi:hypothetical protein